MDESELTPRIEVPPPAKPRHRGVSHEIAAFASPILGLVLVVLAPTTSVRWAALDVRSARVLLGVVWTLAVVGIGVQMLWLNAPRWLVAALYIAIGWTALAFSPTLWRELGAISFSLLVLGGVVYSLGAVVYSTRRPDPVPAVFGYHEVFHALVITAGLVFYAAIVRVVVAA